MAYIATRYLNIVNEGADYPRLELRTALILVEKNQYSKKSFFFNS